VEARETAAVKDGAKALGTSTVKHGARGWRAGISTVKRGEHGWRAATSTAKPGERDARLPRTAQAAKECASALKVAAIPTLKARRVVKVVRVTERPRVNAAQKARVWGLQVVRARNLAEKADKLAAVTLKYSVVRAAADASSRAAGRAVAADAVDSL